ncbi:DENN domain protein [Kalmanozyma brasiliensis GHG001]|uniref:Protein N-terminal and lysine N-methyltransferase EFM7 n=1 Tax=Kalmanozyma brasiliensis (strain GHG001) TaxID=1365824 RepID=V5EQV2_KALBG|nr:DENN domain protein [Kalmanozyma brasiliensis GHG001]EST05323.1 DENN domain protein [Kalmanozyma brasiliensis GHG001]
MPSATDNAGPSRPPSRVGGLAGRFSFSNLSIKSADGRSGARTPKSDRRQFLSTPGPRSTRERTASVSTSKSTDGNNIAQLYAVFGLPKDPAVWTLAEEDCTNGVHHMEGAVGRFWRPEVLGCSICPPLNPVEDGLRSPLSPTSGAEKRNGNAWGSDKKGGSNPKFIEMADGRGGVERAETSRVLAKALKLSFTREIEISSGPINFPPSSTSHTFSFSVPTVKSSTSNGAVRPSTDARKANASTGNAGDDTPSVATFYGSVLTVWSAADEKRAKAIKKELGRLAKSRAHNRSGTMSRSVSNQGEDIEDDYEGVSALGHSLVPDNNAFFMPYAICIVSRYPIYNLLGDWNKAAWFKYSRNIEMHNKLMAAVLRHRAPRIGETFRLQSPDEDVSFVCTFPGAIDWNAGLLGIDFSMWPLFKTLSLDNVLTICEIALAPAGRILFMSRHPALMGTAVETIKYLVELCGWKGVAHQNCHARDVRIYLEDPGSWLIAINTELRSIIKPAKEVCVVDLDINFVKCPRPPLKAPSKGAARDRKRRKLIAALGFSFGDNAIPREYVEAFPSGRFRPLSKVESSSRDVPYECLDTPSWWDQRAVVSAFDQVLLEGTKPSFLKKVLRGRAEKQAAVSETELAAVLVLRKRASAFVDARDGLENKIGRLNKRLAFLMSEGEMWRQQFDKIQQLVDRLTREAGDLRAKLDKERRESRRLTSTLQQRDMEFVQAQIQLTDTEKAREKAQAELLRMRTAMDNLESEREAMMDEIRNVLSTNGADDFDMSSLNNLQSMTQNFGRIDSPAPSDASHNTEMHILKSRALAEQRISMGQPRNNTQLRKSSVAASTDIHANGAFSTGHAASSSNHFPDEQMNAEIQTRTTAVTDQIAKIQQQLESTLTQLEGRRSVTFERERDRRRLSSSSIGSYGWDRGPPSSIGHQNAVASSIGHGHAFESNNPRDDDNPIEEVETVDTERPGMLPRRQRVASSTGHGTSAGVNHLSRAPPPFLTPKSPARKQRELAPAPDSAANIETSPIKANGDTTALPSESRSEAEPVNFTEASSSAAVPAVAGAAIATGAAAAIAGAAASPATVNKDLQDKSGEDAPESANGAPANGASVNGEAATADVNREKPMPDVPADQGEDTSMSKKLDELEKETNGNDVDGEDGDETDGALNMFEEPDDFRPKTPPPTVTYYEFPGTSSKVTLNLVGNHPLWGHLAWNASFILSDFICAHALTLTKGKRVLELGAAAGLPSIVCNWASASHVVATDYPDKDLIDNLTKNVVLNCQDESSPLRGPGKSFVEGYIWGRDASPLLSKLTDASGKPGKFDLILLSDLVFNHQAHPALLETCEACLADAPAGEDLEGRMTTPCVLVFFTHHRPHLAYKDMQFFDMAEVKGWRFEKLGEWFREPMFPEDPGDEVVRSTIHGFRLWRA